MTERSRTAPDPARHHRRPPRGGTPWGITRRTLDALSVRRAFGEPIRQGDVTIVPVARVRGGGGAGYGTGEVDGQHQSTAADSSGAGGGAGFGLAVTPIGV